MSKKKKNHKPNFTPKHQAPKPPHLQDFLPSYPMHSLERTVSTVRIPKPLKKTEQEIEALLAEILLENHEEFGAVDKIMHVKASGDVEINPLLPSANLIVRLQTMSIPRDVDAFIVQVDDEVLGNPLNAFGLPAQSTQNYRAVFYFDRNGRYLQCSVKSGSRECTYKWHDSLVGIALAQRFRTPVLVPQRLQARLGLHLWLSTYEADPEGPDQYVEWFLDTLINNGVAIPTLAHMFEGFATKHGEADPKLGTLTMRQKINVLTNACGPVSQEMLIAEVDEKTDAAFDAKHAVEQIFGTLG